MCAEESVGLKKNILIQMWRFKKIPKIIASLSQPKSYNDDTHDERRGGGGAEELRKM